MFSAEWEKFLWEGIIFLAFILICGGLVERRFSKRTSLLAGGGTLVAILLLQIGLLMAGADATLVLTLLPVTAYLPAIVCLYILSKSGFFQTMAIWTIGAITYFTLKILWKILMKYWGDALLIAVCLALVAGLMVFLVFRFLRGPFQGYVLKNQTNWLVLSFPVLMLFLLLSYFGDSTTDAAVLLLLLLTAVSVFLVLIRVLVSAASVARLKAAEQAVSRQMELERQEYEAVCQRMELGRAYRHDMRHHLMILDGLAREKNFAGITKYIEGLRGKLSLTEKETFCENPTVNAALSGYVAQAREAGCVVSIKAALPKELPFDELDVCAVLANALENAINACRKETGKRYIRLSAELEAQRRLTVLVTNPCKHSVSFDDEGFPMTPKQEGHGIGLRSIDAVAKKYSGMFRCQCREGEFQLQVVLFHAPQPEEAAPPVQQAYKPRPKKLAAAVALGVFAFFMLINCMPEVAQAMAELPGLGALVRVADLRSYHALWGDTSFVAELPVLEEQQGPEQDSGERQTAENGAAPSPTQEVESSASAAPESDQTAEPSPTAKPIPIISEEAGAPPKSEEPSQEPQETPQATASAAPAPTQTETPAPAETPSPTGTPSIPPELSDGLEDMNQQMEEYIQQMRDKFIWYAARKYEGYVGMDVTYEFLRNDERLLSIRFDATLNAGGSGQYSRSFTLDKQTGEILELSSLFQPGSDYIDVISQEILRQMEERVAAGEGDYFIPGGIWSDDECFQQIDADQNFYINADGYLVIVFDEYEVAPGSMGMPEFVIPTSALADILRQPTVLG